ncbi:MAG: hypothetical protein HUU17_07845 [Chthonomonadales bacterium]|nr:hypothetical protein [Chthonomonadales bacterium]
MTDPSPPIYVLGLDSGGTKTDCLVVDASGAIVGQGSCSVHDAASGRGAEGAGRSLETLREAVRRATEPLLPMRVDTLHIAGRASLPDDILDRRLTENLVYHPVRECEGPMALANASAGVVALAGTGAFVYGRTSDGRELCLDALGPLLGDSGSAFDIGLRAIRAVARAHWHPRHATTLVEPVQRACQQFHRKEGMGLVEYMLECPDRSEVASLARIVDAHASSGDGIARRILEEAADGLLETFRDVVAGLDMVDADLPCIAAGSVARKSRIYWERFSDRAARIAPRLRMIVPTPPEVVGVILAASRTMDGIAADFALRLRYEYDKDKDQHG